jgi:gluconate 2-dehydrogenase alpha chain
MPIRENYLDLDPTYRDAWGLPLLRMTFDFPENDVKMIRFVSDRTIEIAKAMPGSTQVSRQMHATRPLDVTVYRATHNTGGAIMGTDPSTSVVNKYQQCWDVPNLFSVGNSSLPHNGTYNNMNTMMALTLFAVDAIRNRYHKSLSPLV